MTEEELRTLAVAKTFDARGTACTGPLLEAKRAIGTISSGEVMFNINEYTSVKEIEK